MVSMFVSVLGSFLFAPQVLLLKNTLLLLLEQVCLKSEEGMLAGKQGILYSRSAASNH